MKAALTLAALLSLATPALASPYQSPEITVSALNQDQWYPDIAFNSRQQEFLVVWHNEPTAGIRNVMASRVDRFGNVIAEFPITSCSYDCSEAAVAYDPDRDRYLVTWHNDVTGGGLAWDIWARLIPAAGPDPNLTSFALDVSPNLQFSPRAAYANTQQTFLVVWTQLGPDAASSGIRAQSIDAATGALAGTTITAATGFERLTPAVAYNHARNEFLVVYTLALFSQADIMGVRINAGGTVLGGGEFGIATWPDTETFPAVAASRIANTWAVVWRSYTTAANYDIYLQRVNGDGSFNGGPVVVASQLDDEHDPAVSCHPESSLCLVSWMREHSGGTSGVYGRTIQLENGVPGAAFPIREVQPGELITCQQTRSAAGRGFWMTTWVQRRDGGTLHDIHGRITWELFGDGFESGSTARWSSAVP